MRVEQKHKYQLIYLGGIPMKGIIFVTFNKLVEEKFGLDVWDDLLGRVDPQSEGVYVSGDTYEDAELMSLVGELSKLTGMGIEDLIRAFGEYALEPLASIYPESINKESMTAKEFLQSVHDIIHIEVKKLYHDAQLPTIKYEDPAPDQLVMIYQSPRKMYMLAEGLIEGTAKYFGIQIERKTIHLTEQGEDIYRFELQFK